MSRIGAKSVGAAIVVVGLVYVLVSVIQLTAVDVNAVIVWVVEIVSTTVAVS